MNACERVSQPSKVSQVYSPQIMFIVPPMKEQDDDNNKIYSTRRFENRRQVATEYSLYDTRFNAD